MSDSGSTGVPGMLTARGSRWASLARSDSPCSVAQPVRPLAGRDLLGQDHLGVAIAGQDRGPDAALAVDPVDRQVVVLDDGPEPVGDPLQDGRGIAGREERLVDVEERPLAGQPMLQLPLLLVQAPDVLGVHQGLGGEPGEDAQGGEVVLARTGRRPSC